MKALITRHNLSGGLKGWKVWVYFWTQKLFVKRIGRVQRRPCVADCLNGNSCYLGFPSRVEFLLAIICLMRHFGLVRWCCLLLPDSLQWYRRLVDFFWSGHHWLRATVLYLPVEEGSQGLIDIPASVVPLNWGQLSVLGLNASFGIPSLDTACLLLRKGGGYGYGRQVDVFGYMWAVRNVLCFVSKDSLRL